VRATLAAHADWSVDPRKRWITVARRRAGSWRIDAAIPVGDVAKLFDSLRARADGGAIALGLDLPLGLPRAFAARHVGEPDFPTFLRALADRPAFFRVCATLDEVSRERPFYPARGMAGMTRAAHAAALGLPGPAALGRLCDRATAIRPAGASLFWTLGPNQSGKAALAAWRDLLIPALRTPDPPLLWPFDGDFASLLAGGRVVVAETYPAEAMRHFGLRLAGSKRRQSDRATLAAPLRAAMAMLDAVAEPALGLEIASGFGADPAGEDRFDSLVGLLCVLNVLAGRRPGGVPDDPMIHRWEGWVLGQTDLPLRPI
jgi:hypothetical protein